MVQEEGMAEGERGGGVDVVCARCGICAQGPLDGGRFLSLAAHVVGARSYSTTARRERQKWLSSGSI